MPTYVYKFVDSGETIEVQQGFHDDNLTEIAHPDSGEMLAVKKVFTPVGVTFKGSGFFKTDNRSKKSSTASGGGDSTSSSASDAGSSSTSDAGSSSTSGSGSNSTSDSKPASSSASSASSSGSSSTTGSSTSSSGSSSGSSS